MLLTIAAAALALQVSSLPSSSGESESLLRQIQYRVFVHPPPCGDGYDLSARDGMCYPNGSLPPQDQAARQYYRGRGYGGGRYPVPCGGNGVDLDIRDGQCYPTGTVPRRYQNRPQYYQRY
jgi:hypothetical protein